MTIFKKFVNKFNRADNIKTSSQTDINNLEAEFKICLPNDFKTFILNYGNVWTLEILDIIVDNEFELNDIQQFWDVEQIIYDKKNEWTSNISTDLIPFASDCMGNIFAFLASDLKTIKETAAIYFYDHDFDKIEKISESFTDWIDKFNQL